MLIYQRVGQLPKPHGSQVQYQRKQRGANSEDAPVLREISRAGAQSQSVGDHDVVGLEVEP